MKSPYVNRLLFPFLSAVLTGAACCLAGTKEERPISPAVGLENVARGNSCVMVFAKVGEPFYFEFSEEGACPSLKCSPGVDVSGEKSELPAGLGFDTEKSALVGVPQHPGFHEYVVLRTEKGGTSEQVVLIDIQGHSFSSGGMQYASYFAGGVH